MMRDWCKIVRTPSGRQVLARIEYDRAQEKLALRIDAQLDGIDANVSILFADDDIAWSAFERFDERAARAFVCDMAWFDDCAGHDAQQVAA